MSFALHGFVTVKSGHIPKQNELKRVISMKLKRVFAEYECEETNSWGCFCPSCKQYQSYECPETGGVQTSCPDCQSKFIVTFHQ
jgi:hypothetical protein